MPSRMIFILAAVSVFSSLSFKPSRLKYESESLKIEQLTKNVFIHISYLDIPNYGKFPCNGMIFRSGNEAIVFDTPTNDTVAGELIKWVEGELGCKVKYVVVNHFHDDCLGGLKAFHDKSIPSYANTMTIKLAAEDGATIPQKGFEDVLILEAGDQEVINQYFGPGHTKDNIVSYIPSEKVLFGGCLIKEMNAGKGNLKDANLEEWPQTVSKVKNEFPKVKYIVPGHGKPGGKELLDYTVKLFSEGW